MSQSVHDAIADAVMRQYHSKRQVRYIAPEDVVVYGRTSADVSRIIRSIIDALRSPHLEGRIRSSTDAIEELEHFADWIVTANRTTLDRFPQLRFLMTAISFIVFCELRSDNQKSQNLYGNGDDDGEIMILKVCTVNEILLYMRTFASFFGWYVLCFVIYI